MRTASTIKRVQKTILPNLGVTLSASSTTYAVWLMTKMMKKRRMKILPRKATFWWSYSSLALN